MSTLGECPGGDGDNLFVSADVGSQCCGWLSKYMTKAAENPKLSNWFGQSFRLNNSPICGISDGVTVNMVNAHLIPYNQLCNILSDVHI